MKIGHIAIWVEDMEALKLFYEKYFGAKAGERYVNPQKQFTSCFLSFTEGCGIELMHKPGLEGQGSLERDRRQGLAHFSISVGSPARVDELTGKLRSDGFAVISGPRVTGDGYYESVVADPGNNLVEITV